MQSFRYKKYVLGLGKVLALGVLCFIFLAPYVAHGETDIPEVSGTSSDAGMIRELPLDTVTELESPRPQDAAADDSLLSPDSGLVYPDDPSQVKADFFRGTVSAIKEEGDEMVSDTRQHFQVLEITKVGTNETIEIKNVTNQNGVQTHVYTKGEQVVVGSTSYGDITNYYIADPYRSGWMIGMVLFFLAIVVLLTKWQGVRSIIGLAASIWVVLYVITPSILKGYDPFLVSVVGALLVVVLSVFVAHGLHKRTVIAVVSTLITLLFAAGFGMAATWLMQLSGSGDDQALLLQYGAMGGLNLKGILLGGIIIGTLGVLDDITTAQAAVVQALKEANPSLRARELYARAIRVGREHISSLVNTLVLAYAGTSMPLFLLFHVDNMYPLWVILNSEFVAQELVRTIVGSTALVLAVPVTTGLAAWYFGRASFVVSSGDGRGVDSHAGHFHGYEETLRERPSREDRPL